MLDIPLDIRRHNHAYVIRIGAFGMEGALAEIEQGVPAERYAAVVDPEVARIYNLDALVRARPGWRIHYLQPGEENKTGERYLALCEAMLAAGMNRKTVMAAIGGGVVGDMTGFAAATLLRGVRFVQVPTTLLAQVDSSVGGKTGVNMAGGKNLLGAFHQPDLVVIDPAFLKSLSEREYRSGLAEVAKYGVLGDGEFFARLAADAQKLADRDPDVLAEIIAHCCRMKADIVGDDEKETERRHLLNLGHTFGHALEALAGYDGSLLHGEAVAVGTCMASRYAAARGTMPEADCREVARVFAALKLPCGLADVQPEAAEAIRRGVPTDALPAALGQDKKAATGGLTLVLPVAVGRCEIVRNVPVSGVAEAMRAFCAQENGTAQ